MSDIKKILVIVDSIDVNDSSGSKANVALILNLKEAGFKVKVYHYTQKEVFIQDVECVSIPEKKGNGMYFLSRFQRVFTRLTKINLNPQIERLFGFSFTFFNDTNSILNALKRLTFLPDLVLTLSKGTSFRPHYAVLKLPQLHHKWMAYIHDPYPFYYYPNPYKYKESGFRQKEYFFREVSEKAKYTAFPSLLLKEWMGNYFSNFSETGVIIPHQNAKYVLKKTEFPSYFNPYKFNLLHAGNLMKQRSPEGLIEGFNLFLKRCPEAKQDARLLFVGPASYYAKMLASLKKTNPAIYAHIGNVSFDEVYYLQQKVSVNIILEAKSEISPFLPAKFPHCVEGNNLILALGPYHSETKRLLGADYPFWSEIDDVGKIAGLIEKLYLLWKQNHGKLLLNRSDLENYLSDNYLKKVINELQTN